MVRKEFLPLNIWIGERLSQLLANGCPKWLVFQIATELLFSLLIG
jgi:hypothetical protein